ncbi:MAG: Calx-beta domain-containing protein [Planctomycetota bacterium]|jgi:hypothetical protein
MRNRHLDDCQRPLLESLEPRLLLDGAVVFAITGDAMVAEGNIASYVVSYTGTLTGSATIQVDTGPGTQIALPDATEGVDYNSADSILTFLASGPTSMTVQVATFADALVEGDEDFSLSLSNPSQGVIVVGQVNTIIVDTTPPPVEFSVAGNATVAEGNIASYIVSYTGTLTGSATIQVDTGPGTHVAIPDATEGVDYNSADSILTFLVGGPTSAAVQVATLADALVEGDEDFSVSLSNPSQGVIVVGQVNTVIVDANDPPVITDLGLAEDIIDENDTVTLTGEFTDGNADNAHQVTVDWGDGLPPTVLNLAVGERTFSASHACPDDNPTATSQDDYTITVTVSDGTDSDTDATVVTVMNCDPAIGSLTCSVSGPVGSQQVDLAGNFTDIGPEDTHTVMIDWGDGTVEPATVTQGSGAGSLAASHSYAAAGVYTISVTVTDDDTGEAATTVTEAIAGVRLRDGVLEIIGTDERDWVTINQTGKGKLKVHASFLPGRGKKAVFNLADVDRITMLLGDGNDIARISGRVDLLAIVDGGAGNDHLKAGRGPSVLMGAEGNDRLIGGSGRDVLIGGVGRDKLLGGPGDDILIGGRTIHDIDDDALTPDFDAPLLAIVDEWTSANDYDTRVANLTNGGGANGGVTLAVGTSVLDDGEFDLLRGGSGRDWLVDWEAPFKGGKLKRRGRE